MVVLFELASTYFSLRCQELIRRSEVELAVNIVQGKDRGSAHPVFLIFHFGPVTDFERNMIWHNANDPQRAVYSNK
jgi:hypothetical protein